MRLSFIGVGNIASQHMRYLREFPDVEIVGLYDTDKKTLRARQREFGG